MRFILSLLASLALATAAAVQGTAPQPIASTMVTASSSSAFTQSPATQEATAEDRSSADTRRFVEIVDGTVLGGWSVRQEAPDTWIYESDRKYHFKRAERLVLDGDGLPKRLETTGRISDGVPWHELFEREGASARWATPRARGQTRVRHPAFYESVYPAHDLGVLARALLRQRSRSLPLLPEGEARLEPLAERIVEASGQTSVLRLFAVHGLDLLPAYVWLDENDATFADEWSVRAGWEPTFAGLRTVVDEAIAERRRQMAKKVVPPARERPLVIRNARLFDSRTGKVRESTTILVDGERIAAVASDETLKPSAGAEVIDARGRMALPGLWDVHAHMSIPADDDQISTRGAAPLHLAAGVTSVRDVGSHVPSLLALQEAIEADEAIGPRIFAAGFLYDSSEPDVTGFPVGTTEEARAAVDRYAELGFRQIKLHLYGSELARAAIARAKEHGMGVTGHIPDDMTSRDAVGAGYDVMMHLWWILWSAEGTRSESLAKVGRWENWHQIFAELTPDSQPVRDLVALLAERGVAVDPTIGYFVSESTPPEFIAEVVERFPAPVERRFRHKVWSAQYFPRSPLARPARERAIANLMALLPILHRSGVPVLPGTDTWPGFGLHYELELYARAGIPAPEVLSLATLGAARVMGTDDELGSIEPGKFADIILVDGDPTADIGDIRRVTTVIKGGRVYDPTAIYRALGIAP